MLKFLDFGGKSIQLQGLLGFLGFPSTLIKVRSALPSM